MLPEYKKQQIEQEADKYGFQVPYDGSDKFYADGAVEGYTAGATAEATKSLVLVEALEKITENYYPESLFAPLTEAEWTSIRQAIRELGLSVDRLSAHYGRILLKPNQRIATDALNEYKK